MKLVERGMMVKVLYYSAGEYVSVEGIVSKIDLDFRKLTVVKTEIDLDGRIKSRYPFGYLLFILKCFGAYDILRPVAEK